MRNIVVLLVMFTCVVPSFGFTTMYGNSYNGGFNSRLRMNSPNTVVSSYQPRRVNNYNNFSPRRLDSLERYVLKKRFARESNLSRLERLEELAFGAVQTGDYLTRYNNVENAILSRPNYGYRRSVLGNIANFFSGQLTGFTPGIMTQPSVLTQDLTPAYIPGLNNGFGTNYSPFNMGNSPVNSNFISPPSNFFETAGYGNTSQEGYSNGFGSGYGIRSENFNSGVGVKILD